jgi:hypothetical protein
MEGEGKNEDGEKSNRGSEYDQSTLYTCIGMSQSPTKTYILICINMEKPLHQVNGKDTL